jgi:hypothetical protein
MWAMYKSLGAINDFSCGNGSHSPRGLTLGHECQSMAEAKCDAVRVVISQDEARLVRIGVHLHVAAEEDRVTTCCRRETRRQS